MNHKFVTFLQSENPIVVLNMVESSINLIDSIIKFIYPSVMLLLDDFTKKFNSLAYDKIERRKVLSHFVGIFEAIGEIDIDVHTNWVRITFSMYRDHTTRNLAMFKSIVKHVGGEIIFADGKIKWSAKTNPDILNIVSLLTGFEFLTQKMRDRYYYALYIRNENGYKTEKFNAKDFHPFEYFFNPKSPWGVLIRRWYFSDWLSGYIEGKGWFITGAPFVPAKFVLYLEDIILLEWANYLLGGNISLNSRVTLDGETGRNYIYIKDSAGQSKLAKHLYHYPLLGEKGVEFINWDKIRMP